MTITEQIQYLIKQSETQYPGRCRTESDVLYFLKGAVTLLLRAKLEELEQVAAQDPPREVEPIHMEKNP